MHNTKNILDVFKHPNRIELAENIIVIPNFISWGTVREVLALARDTDYSIWPKNRPDPTQMRDHSQGLEIMVPIVNKIRMACTEGYFPRRNLNIIKLETGDFWGEHVDSDQFLHLRKLNEEYEKQNELAIQDGKDPLPYKEVNNNVFGMILYFNKADGGEIYYPNQDNFEYSPNPGDLLLHSSEELCRHGVKPVKSGTRYSYSNAIYEKIKVSYDAVLDKQ